MRRASGIGRAVAVALGLSGCVTLMGPPLYSHGEMASFTTTPASGQPDRFSHENPVPPSSTSVAAGARVYQEHCAECHGGAGRGDGPARDELDGPQPPDLVRAARRRTEGELYGLIAFGRPDMPAWRKVIGETDLWNLVNFLRIQSGVAPSP